VCLSFGAVGCHGQSVVACSNRRAAQNVLAIPARKGYSCGQFLEVRITNPFIEGETYV
jgi:hypothetical protein